MNRTVIYILIPIVVFGLAVAIVLGLIPVYLKDDKPAQAKTGFPVLDGFFLLTNDSSSIDLLTNPLRASDLMAFKGNLKDALSEKYKQLGGFDSIIDVIIESTTSKSGLRRSFAKRDNEKRFSVSYKVILNILNIEIEQRKSELLTLTRNINLTIPNFPTIVVIANPDVVIGNIFNPDETTTTTTEAPKTSTGLVVKDGLLLTVDDDSTIELLSGQNASRASEFNAFKGNLTESLKEKYKNLDGFESINEVTIESSPTSKYSAKRFIGKRAASKRHFSVSYVVILKILLSKLNEIKFALIQFTKTIDIILVNYPTIVVETNQNVTIENTFNAEESTTTSRKQDSTLSSVTGTTGTGSIFSDTTQTGLSDANTTLATSSVASVYNTSSFTFSTIVAATSSVASVYNTTSFAYSTTSSLAPSST